MENAIFSEKKIGLFLDVKYFKNRKIFCLQKPVGYIRWWMTDIQVFGMNFTIEIWLHFSKMCGADRFRTYSDDNYIVNTQW